MYFLRFTNNPDTTTSFDHFEGTELRGICAFMLEVENFEDLAYVARMTAEKDDTYLKFYNGEFIIFEGSYIEDNPYGNGVVAKKGNIVMSGTMIWNENTRTYVIN